MKFGLFLMLFCLLLSRPLLGQENKIYTSDLINFWIAYDSIQSLDNFEDKVNMMQSLYVEKATLGLLDFMQLRNFDSGHLVKTIENYPKFWESIRPNTNKVLVKQDSLESYVQRFMEVYPTFREAQIYFTISGIKSGGTTKGSKVLIGTEIAVGNKNTDVSEFPDNRLENFFATQTDDNIIPFCIHEYVHTQQEEESDFLLGQSIYEGACDFITELVLDDKELNHAYLVYGRENELEIKKKFKAEMWGTDFSAWLYNGNTEVEMGDLGYFMGYMICKSYYSNYKNKEKAVKDIIELPYNDEKKVKKFLKKANYF